MKLSQIHKILRTSDWWNNILPPIIGFYFIGKLHAFNYNINLLEIIFLFTLMIGIAVFGFALGEWTDIKDDEKVGKKNQLANTSFILKVGIIIAALLVVVVSSFFLQLSILLLVLVLIQLLCFVLYSVPPLRLKKYILTSLMLDATYSGTLMYILAFSLSQSVVYEPILIGIGIWGFAKGARNYLLHTLNDAENDERLGIKSFGNSYSKNLLDRIKFIILPIEIMSLIFVFLLIDSHPIKLVAAYILVLIFATYHQSKSLQLGKFKFVANINLFHEVAILMIAVVLFSINNILGLVLFVGFAIIFPSIGLWIVSGVKKLSSKSFYSNLKA